MSFHAFPVGWSRRESNSYLEFRKLLFYPLNYGTFADVQMYKILHELVNTDLQCTSKHHLHIRTFAHPQRSRSSTDRIGVSLLRYKKSTKNYNKVTDIQWLYYFIPVQNKFSTTFPRQYKLFDFYCKIQITDLILSCSQTNIIKSQPSD